MRHNAAETHHFDTLGYGLGLDNPNAYSDASEIFFAGGLMTGLASYYHEEEQYKLHHYGEQYHAAGYNDYSGGECFSRAGEYNPELFYNHYRDY